MAIPIPNSSLDSDGLPDVRFITINDPVFATTANRPHSDMRARTVAINDKVKGTDHNGISTYLRVEQRDTPDNTVLLKFGKLTTKGGRQVVEIAEDFASAITFPNVSAAGQERYDVLGINMSTSTPAVIRVQGTESAGSPTIPFTPEYIVPLAAIFINETVTVTITNDDIKDLRPFLSVPASPMPVGTMIDYFFTPGASEVEQGWLPLIGTITIGNTGSGATYTGDQFKVLYNKIKTLTPNTGSEDFDSGDPVTLPNLTKRIAIGIDSTEVTIDALGKVTGTFTHNHTIPDHTHTVGAHTHTINADGAHDHTGNTALAGADLSNWERKTKAEFGASIDLLDAESPGNFIDHAHNIPEDGSHSHGGSTTGPTGDVNTGAAGAGNTGTGGTPPVISVYKLIKY